MRGCRPNDPRHLLDLSGCYRRRLTTAAAAGIRYGPGQLGVRSPAMKRFVCAAAYGSMLLLMRSPIAGVSGDSAGGSAADQVGPGCDAQFAEDLAQVVVDRAGAEEQLGSDVAVRQALSHQPCDLEFLRCELVWGRGLAFAGGLAGGAQFRLGALRPWDGAERAEQVAGGAQMPACLGALALAAQ